MLDQFQQHIPKQFRIFLVVDDYFRRFVRVLPLSSAVAKSIVTTMEEEITLLFSVPQYFICHKGKQFVSKAFMNLWNFYKA